MRLLYYSLSLYLSLTSASPEPAAKTTTTPVSPCATRSPSSGAFFDLQPLHILPPAESKLKHPRHVSWNTTGYDYGYNFTLNFCGPVLEEIKDVVGVERGLWQNVSAYYKTGDGDIFSLGNQNDRPVIRGRKLVLNYTGGSPCGPDVRDRRAALDYDEREIIDDDDKKKKKPDDKEDRPKKPESKAPMKRKSTIISMLCDRDPLAPTLSLSFVGTDPDHCAYFFEARSATACGGIEVAKQTLSPSGVFGTIALVAIMVYVVGGCVYSRMVLNQRGWRQLPNYALWSGIGGFVRDVFVILTSSCARFLPSRRGYSRVNSGLNGSASGARGRGRGDSSDAENRLIDELNEEWDD
nr:hypothetical protein B0A51_16157 [Rachicladosporium sp. CCFEE 5018]OQO21583.1 hypothetical protein B0A51_13341 [Rachicladosporium sp. CCFEE 5018]